MKIEKIELYQLDLPYSGGVYRLSGGREYRSFDASFVRVVTDDGLDGWGESTPFGSNRPGLGLEVHRDRLGEPIEVWANA